MVHVISAHHFGGQEVVTIDPPLAITAGPDNILFVSTPDHSLHILDMFTGEPVKPPFSTVDAAVSICYSQHGDYVAALEAKESRSSPDFSYIRVYRHWSQQERAQPMRARIAARVTPPSSGADPTLEMIEVPINEHATAIACCQRTGNLAVACGTLVTVHQFVLKTHDISKFQFADLEEVVQLELAFEVTELALCEELLVCAGADRLQLLQLSCVTGASRSSASTSSTASVASAAGSAHRPEPPRHPPRRPPSLDGVRENGHHHQHHNHQQHHQHQQEEEDSEDSEEEDEDDMTQVVWDPAVPERSRGLSTSSRRSLRLALPALHRPLVTAADSGPVPRLLPAAGRPGIHAESLLYWREPDGESLVPGALCVTPFYERDEPTSNDVGAASDCLQSSDRALLSAVSVFFSSSHEGRLYQVAPLWSASSVGGGGGGSAGGGGGRAGGGGERPYAALVGTHTYTAPLVLAARQPHMLHAITHTGLESYTVRDTRRLSRLQCPPEPCPDPTDSGCLLGLQPFVNVTHMCVGAGVLALAASGPEDSDSATLYLLRLPPTLELYWECARLAGTHDRHAPAMCLALLEEAHMVLRPAVRWQASRPPDERIAAEFAHSAANIGYFLLRSSSEADWPRAVPWLRLASASVEDVLSQCGDAPGLESYLSSTLSDPAQPPLSYQTANQALSALSCRAPEVLAAVLLSAGPLREYRAEPPLEALQQLLEDAELAEPAAQSARLAALLLLARGGAAAEERRRPLLGALSDEALPAGCTHLLLEDCAGRRRLTELAELLADGRPDLLAAGLAALAAAGRPSLPELIGLLLEAADTSDRRAALRYELLLRDVLERHLQAGGRPQHATHAVTLLVRMYLGGTVGAFPPPQTSPNPAATGGGPSLERHRLGALYGPRAAWLNLLPPFVGRTPTQILADMESDPRLVDLVMLQSLLCSDLPSAEDRRNIGQFLVANPTAAGHDALQVLCSDLPTGAALLADRHAEAVLEYAKERCSSPSEWRAVLLALSTAQQQQAASDDPSAGQQSAAGALGALLDHLASALPPDQLRQVLAESADQHRACLLRCHSVQRADVVRAEIVKMA